MSNIDVIIKFWKIARISSCGTKKYRQTSLMKKSKHRTMSEDDVIALIRQSFDRLFDYNDLSYTYNPLDELPRGGYVYNSSLWIRMTANCYLFVINMSMLLCNSTTTSTRLWQYMHKVCTSQVWGTQIIIDLLRSDQMNGHWT